ncbi:hypothetical protein [Sphingomonas sp. LY160]|uniref:hypothetical protein n=1 Tax=Sphingomonas sp. LY160 TaxID=3095342 RepID=UPI002ADEF58A|nr:hypothetical protein [Sphingomonas sp. LY160]MEA1071725.1 hypothetical protein [Sphingomonas sp. LY160]
MANTGELSALVVRNIGDIEEAIAHTLAKIDARIFEEVGREIEERLGARNWFVYANVEDRDIFFAHRLWIPSGVKPYDTPYWFKLDEQVSASGGTNETWLSEFLRVGPEDAAVALILRGTTIKPQRWKALIKANADLIERLVDTGFKLDDDQRLTLPILLEAETLAIGFESDDLSEALQPLRDALDVIEAARDDLDALISRDSGSVDVPPRRRSEPTAKL